MYNLHFRIYLSLSILNVIIVSSKMLHLEEGGIQLSPCNKKQLKR